MKTKKTNQESTNSTQKNVEQKSYNWQNGASSSIGAAIGVAAGSMAQTAFATEPVTEGLVQPPHTDTPTVTSEVPLTSLIPLPHLSCPETATMNRITKIPSVWSPMKRLRVKTARKWI